MAFEENGRQRALESEVVKRVVVGDSFFGAVGLAAVFYTFYVGVLALNHIHQRRIVIGYGIKKVNAFKTVRLTRNSSQYC